MIKILKNKGFFNLYNLKKHPYRKARKKFYE